MNGELAPFFDRRSMRGTLLQVLREPGIVWLAGPRGTGKTTLVSNLEDATYFDLEDPAVRRKLRNPAKLIRLLTTRFLLLDEVHLVDNLEGLFEAGTRGRPLQRIVAVSSSLASPPDDLKDKFRIVQLPLMQPVRLDELPQDSNTLALRLHHGGLPAALLSPTFPSDYFASWLDSFVRLDVLPRFRLQNASLFRALLVELCKKSGGILKQASLADQLPPTENCDTPNCGCACESTTAL
jgi:predicted AAA+ superfamily ATPase